jgi:hypothetical protein
MKNMKYNIIFRIAFICVSLFTAVPNILAQGTEGKPIPLTIGVWKQGEMTDSVQELWYTINITDWVTEIRWKDNILDLQDTYTLFRAIVSIYNENNVLLKSGDEDSWPMDGYHYYLSGPGKIKIKVSPAIPFDNYQYGTNGTFVIGAFK